MSECRLSRYVQWSNHFFTAIIRKFDSGILMRNWLKSHSGYVSLSHGIGLEATFSTTIKFIWTGYLQYFFECFHLNRGMCQTTNFCMLSIVTTPFLWYKSQKIISIPSFICCAIMSNTHCFHPLQSNVLTRIASWHEIVVNIFLFFTDSFSIVNSQHTRESDPM